MAPGLGERRHVVDHIAKPAQFAAFIKSERERWGDVVRKAGIEGSM